MDPEPSSQLNLLALAFATLPALGAAVFGAASASLAALSGARIAAVRDSVEGGRKRALDRYLTERRKIETRYLVLRVLGIAISAVLMAQALLTRDGSWGAVVAALLALVAYGLPAEMLKAFVLRNPDWSAPFLLRVLRPLEWLVTPVAVPLTTLAGLVTRGPTDGSIPPPSAQVMENEVELVINESEQTGAIDHEQSEMIRNVLDFGDLNAGDVMVPRTQVMAFEPSTPVDELLRCAKESGHSRYPVYRDRIDNVIGLLHTKDLLGQLTQVEDLDALKIDSLIRTPAVFVPETRSASSVLKEMRAGRHHMAIVIDEFGGMAGIVTLEDLVEEIVGDIRDEHDGEEPSIVEREDGSLLVDAAVAINDLEPYLGTELPDERDYHSLGGFLVDRLGRVPGVGTRLVAHGHEFVVRDANPRRVAKVEIIPTTRPSQPSDPQVTAA